MWTTPENAIDTGGVVTAKALNTVVSKQTQSGKLKIAVLSDTRLPTAANYPGHGLGKINLAIANGLRKRGHDVTLFAGWGSEFDGTLETGYHERDFYKDDKLVGFDVVIDGGHEHGAALALPDVPIINVSHDREHKPGRCAVYVSDAHRRFWHDADGKVIHNGIDVEAHTLRNSDKPSEYVAWMAHFDGPKGPLAAREAARLAGVPLKMAGHGDPLHGVEFLGAVEGDAKTSFIHGARVLLCPFSTESAGLVALEAAACGVPVIGFDLAGLPEFIADGVTGFLVESTDDMANAISRVGEINGAAARAWVAANRSEAQMVAQYEALCSAVVNGVRW